MLKKEIINVIEKLGYTVSKKKNNLAEYSRETEFLKKYNICKQFSMTSIERMFALHQTVNYIASNNIEGDIVECGVWKGGSSMMAALSLIELGDSDRELFLYDTFEGMSTPTEKDISINGDEVLKNWDSIKKFDKINCFSPLEEVSNNLKLTGYPIQKIHLIKGKVEETIPGKMPNKIALLRLDTDWYESTLHELVHLFPKLVKGGVLIIDDYGHWEGARDAVDTYFKKNHIQPLLMRIDYTGRLMINL